MFNDETLNQAVHRSIYGSNPAGAQAMTQLEMQEMQVRRVQNAAQQSTLLAAPGAYNPTMMMSGAAGVGSSNSLNRNYARMHFEVDKVTNGFTLKCGPDLLIAKDIEELRDLFVSQVASRLLEDK